MKRTAVMDMEELEGQKGVVVVVVFGRSMVGTELSFGRWPAQTV